MPFVLSLIYEFNEDTFFIASLNKLFSSNMTLAKIKKLHAFFT